MKMGPENFKAVSHQPVANWIQGSKEDEKRLKTRRRRMGCMGSCNTLRAVEPHIRINVPCIAA